MLNQHLLTVGLSTLVAGTVTSVALPAQPFAIVAASTVAAVGGSLLTRSRHSQPTQSRVEVLLEGGVMDALSKLEDLSIQHTTELIFLKELVKEATEKSQAEHFATNDTHEYFVRFEKLLEDFSAQNATEWLELKQHFNQVQVRDRSLPAAAIFYDVENLLKGYNRSNGMSNTLSIKKILNTIQELEGIEKIAIQKAYANWSIPGLRNIRREVNELGIDPVQVLGFSHEPTKNAADFQLVIDALNLANTRPTIEVFVIVSGDGGFTSLVNPLRERGKTVIGCAYKSSASRYFQNACDQFIALSDPSEPESVEPAPFGLNQVTPTPPDNLYKLDPRNARLAKHMKQRVPTSPEEALRFTQEILQWYNSDPECRSDLEKSGLLLSFIKQGVVYTIPKLKTTLYSGFPKFSEYMQYVCKGTEFCLARLSPTNSNVALFLRDTTPEEAEVLPDLEKRAIHSLETYRSILKTGRPIYQFPSPLELHAIVSWIITQLKEPTDIETLTRSVVTGLNEEIELDTVKQALRSLITAEIFEQEPEDAPLSEQKLSLKEDMRSLETIIDTLRDAAAQKLSDAFSSFSEDMMCDENLLQQILPSVV